MRAVSRFVMLAAALLLAGCHAPLRIVPAADAPQTTETIDGDAWIVSHRRDRVAMRWVAPATSTAAAPPTFAIEVDHPGPDALVVALADISVASGEKPVRLFTPDEQVAQIQRHARLAALSIEAQRHEDTVREEKQIFDAGGWAGSLPSPGPAMKAQAAILRLDQSVAAARGDVARMWDRLVIPAGGSGRGLVLLHGEDIIPHQPLTVTARIGGETHTFYFAAIRGGASPVR